MGVGILDHEQELGWAQAILSLILALILARDWTSPAGPLGSSSL